MLAQLVLVLLLLHPGITVADSGELVYLTEGNRLRRFDIDTLDHAVVAQDILIEREGDGGEGGSGGTAVNGRDINGMVCTIPDGSGRFVAGEDTGQPNPPAGWGIFAPDGTQVGKLTPTYPTELPGVPGSPETFGCAFNSQGVLFTTSVGTQGVGTATGQLIMWFPPFEGFPGPPGAYPETDERSSNFCKLAVDLSTATGIAIDADDNVYVGESGGLRVTRFSPPFPTGLGPGEGCEAADPQNGSPMAEVVNRSVAIRVGVGYSTFTGLAMAPNGNLYAASIVNGTIGEFRLDAAGPSIPETLVRNILAPPAGESFPFSTGSPQGIAVDGQGSIYYADLDLVGVFPNLGPGPNGKLRRITFDENGEPLPPQIVKEGLAFPDGASVLSGSLPASEWRTYAGGPERRFHNAEESIITADNVGGLAERWRFPTNAIITGSPSVAFLDVPDEGPQQIAYIQSWDGFVYAVRVKDGSELWKFETEFQPGANFPNTASAHVEAVGGREQVFIGSGHVFYALDALTGEEIWRFTVGTGCVDENGNPPGSCSFADERNEIESSAIIADGVVVFGMDVNDRTGGKGGLYGIDAVDGRMRWFFDLESGQTCTPDPGDDIRRFDGYHTEAELGLPAGFLATRSGCDFPRSPNGCGNVWSTPAWDEDRGLLYITSSNCDTDTDPNTPQPGPIMPPYDEALFALDTAGHPAWRWRAYDVDNDDFAYGAAPNLFEIEVPGYGPIDVVGVGQKDGHYRVFDRDGVNELNGIDCTVANGYGVVGCVLPAVGGAPEEPSGFPDFPYWDTQVVLGGAVGGIPLTASVDQENRRVYFGSAPGFDPLAPEQPTIHALDIDDRDGENRAWNNCSCPNPPCPNASFPRSSCPIKDASFAPASSIPGLAFFGSTITPTLRAHDTRGDDGSQIFSGLISGQLFGAAVASGPVVVDGTLLVGTGIGFRSGNPQDPGNITSNIPSDLVALCVAGTPGCAPCNDGVDNDLDGAVDGDDAGCTSAGDLSERPDCLDLLDNDHDGKADWGVDPGCFGPSFLAKEAPACDDGVDNDEDGDVDLDDRNCRAAWFDAEEPQRCGLIGLEPLALAAALAFARRRQARARREGPNC